MRLDLTPLDDGIAQLEEAIEYHGSDLVSRDPALKLHLRAAASEEFLGEVRGMGRRNLAVELLERLLKGESATRRRKNVVQARSFAEMLEHTIRRYQNCAVEAAQVIGD